MPYTRREWGTLPANPYGRQWRKRRRAHLRASPLCVMCEADGVYTPATVADHVEPHEGDALKFWTGRLQSLCAYHHDSHKQRIEGGAVIGGVDADGWPIGR